MISTLELEESNSVHARGGNGGKGKKGTGGKRVGGNEGKQKFFKKLEEALYFRDYHLSEFIKTSSSFLLQITYFLPLGS